MEIGKTLVTRSLGEATPFNASDALAAVCDLYGLPIPRTIRARIGKAAKELLDDGFEANVVCAAMFASVRRARPDLVPVLALEIQNAQTGQTTSLLEWKSALHAIKREQSPEVGFIHTTLKESFR